MADLDVTEVDPANNAMEQRAALITQIAALASLTTITVTAKFSDEGENYPFVFLSTATPASAEDVAFDAINAAVNTYLTALQTAQETILTNLGVTY